MKSLSKIESANLRTKNGLEKLKKMQIRKLKVICEFAVIIMQNKFTLFCIFL